MPHFSNTMYVVDAHFIDKIELKKNTYPGPKCLWFLSFTDNATSYQYINILLCMLFNLTCALFILVLGYLCMKIFKNVFRIF
jgi:hypothetical protein